TNFKVKVRIVEESYAHLLEGKPENFSPFRPGMTATVDIITNKRSDVVGVPISAIVIKSDTSSTKNRGKVTASAGQRFETVFVKEGELAKLRVVKTGIQDDQNIEIITGLEAGEIVITGPYNTVTKKLESGDKVEVNIEEKNKDKE